MEAKLFRALYRHVQSVAHPRRRPREQYGDRWIVMVYLWSVLHDRPVCWACDERNWPKVLLDGRPLPSASRMSRRLRGVGVPQLIERVTAAAGDLFGAPPLVKVIDSKPLCVGAYSKDADAKRGRLADGQFAKGYRLHAVTHGRAVRHWTLLPLSAHDSVAAPHLLPRLEGGGGYVVADNAYDTNDCHGLAAGARHQLLAPPRACNKDVRDAAHNRPERLRALDMLHSPLEKCGLRSSFGRDLYNLRQRIESGFGGLSFAGLGMSLPPWVRGARRVALWTAAKILLYLCRCAMNKGLMA
jgi:hypothetical protein